MSTTDTRFEGRKQAVEAVQRGESSSVVSGSLGISLRIVLDRLFRCRADGWHGLSEGLRAGRPCTVSVTVTRWLYQAIQGDPTTYALQYRSWMLKVVREIVSPGHGPC